MFPAIFDQSALNHASTVPAFVGKKQSRSSRNSYASAQHAWECVWYQNPPPNFPPSVSARSPGSPETPSAKKVSSYFGNGSCAAGRTATRLTSNCANSPLLSLSGMPYSSMSRSVLRSPISRRSLHARGWITPSSRYVVSFCGGRIWHVQRGSLTLSGSTLPAASSWRTFSVPAHTIFERLFTSNSTFTGFPANRFGTSTV